MIDRCVCCNARLDRPGEYGCKNADHPAPDTAQKVVEAILRNLQGRRGFHMECLSNEAQDNIRWVLEAEVRSIIKEKS